MKIAKGTLKSHHVCVIRDSKYVAKDVKCYNSGSLRWGGDSHCVTKRASLCLASVCFFGAFFSFEKSRSPAQKKHFGGKTWAGAPYIMWRFPRRPGAAGAATEARAFRETFGALSAK